MADTARTPILTSSVYGPCIRDIFTKNPLSEAQASLKQIAKILQAIAKKPNDKKLREQPTQSFIIKKFIAKLSGGMELMQALGFTEKTIDNKPYLVLPDEHTTISLCDSIADDLLSIASNNNPLADGDASTSTTTTTAMQDDVTPPSTTAPTTIAGEPTTDTPVENAPPSKCTKGCGFFANKQFDGMCSACYKVEQKKSSLSPPILSKSSSTPTTTTISNPLLKNKRFANGQCITPKCPYQSWKTPPAQWESLFTSNINTPIGDIIANANTLSSTSTQTTSPTTENNEMSDEQQQPPAPSPISTPITPPSQPSPALTCQYCSIQSCVAKHHQTQPKTLEDKKRSIRTKIHALHSFQKVMRAVQHDKGRCWECNRKLAITGFECKCLYHFCGLHRYADTHNCTYDHVKRYTDTLKNNLIVADLMRSKLENDDE